jgi:hypothetical protein
VVADVLVQQIVADDTNGEFTRQAGRTFATFCVYLSPALSIPARRDRAASGLLTRISAVRLA